MTAPARVLIVDDSVVIRGLLTKFIEAETDLTVVGSAPNGVIGLRKIASLEPDLVVLDIEMPEMDGLETLTHIREMTQTLPVIMFSTLTDSGAAVTLEALAKGASDYASKPSNGHGSLTAMEQVRGDLIVKIRQLVSAKPQSALPTQAPTATPTRPRARTSLRTPIDAVIVGSSTGGPVALEVVLSSIARPLPVPMFIVQHMPPTFTAALAARLDRKTSHHVVEGAHGQTAEPGTCYVAPGAFHMTLARTGAGVAVIVRDGEPINSCKPSVDPLFESAVDVYGGRLLTVMLTGMGADGCEGTRRAADAGADVVIQDEATSVVWGMPGAVSEAGLATHTLPLDEIGGHIATVTLARHKPSAAPSGFKP